MVNGKLPTWFVVKWLEKHPTHTAKAPRTASGAAETRIVSKGTLLLFEYHFMGMWRDSLPQYRSDWAIYNERGKRVRFKQRKPTMTVPPYGTLTMRSRIRIGEVLKALDKPLEVFVRERRL